MAKRKSTKTTAPDSCTIERSALGIHHFCASDESRPVLSTVKAHKGVLAAADGFMLATVEAPGVTAEAPVLFLGSDLAKLRTKTTSAEPATLAPHNETGWLGTGAAKPKEPVVIETVDGTFPDVDQIFDNVSESGIEATTVLNADLLKKMLAWLGPDADRGAIQFRLRGAGRGVEVRALTTDDRKMRGLIMPMMIAGQGTEQGRWFAEGLPADDEAPEEEEADVEDLEAVTA